MADAVHLSIVIPVLNEAERLDRCLASLQADLQTGTEIIVCDGGSVDESHQIAGKYPCRLLQCEPGRSIQMNAASRLARGEWLLFLHADSRLPEDYRSEIEDADTWGFFRLRLSGKHFLFPVISSAVNLRSSLSRVAGGDQGLFFKRRFFESIGGFPPIPLMEDIAICKTARRRSRPKIVKRSLLTSSRRWREQGIFKTVVLMWSLRFAYWLGVDPLQLHRIYYPQRGR